LSIRQVVIPAIGIPGVPAGTPNVPNAAPPETCDRNPVVS